MRYLQNLFCKDFIPTKKFYQYIYLFTNFSYDSNWIFNIKKKFFFLWW